MFIIFYNKLKRGERGGQNYLPLTSNCPPQKTPRPHGPGWRGAEGFGVRSEGSPMKPMFERYIGIDYSGAQTPKSSLKGLRVYEADRLTAAHEVVPPPSPRKYWTRRGIAEWLVERLSEGPPTLVGIDHGFSFPLRYFEQHGLPLDWPSFLDDFQRHWPTDEDIYVDFVRDGSSGNGAARSGNPRWRRLTELRARTSQVGLPFRCAGVGGEVHARRNSVAALHPAAR